MGAPGTTGASSKTKAAPHRPYCNSLQLLQHVALRLVVQGEDAIASVTTLFAEAKAGLPTLRFKVVHQVHLPHSQVLAE